MTEALYFSNEFEAEDAVPLPKGVATFTVRIEGVDITGLQAGSSNLPTLVFLHGQYCDATTWLAQLGSTELQKKFHMIAWNAPGYAGSEPWPHSNPSALNFALMLKAWLDAQGKKQVHLLGHGLGALIASAFSARFVREVEGLLLLAPEMGAMRSGVFRRQSGQQDNYMLTTFGQAAFCKEKLRVLLSPDPSQWDEESKRRLYITFNLPETSPIVLKLTPDQWLSCAKSVERGLLNLDPEVFEVSSWTLLNEDLESYRRYYHGYCEVWSAQFDQMVKSHDAKRLAFRYHSPYEVFLGVGHFFHLEDPLEFNRSLISFYERLKMFSHKQTTHFS